jgi:hypothetical protein
MNRYYQIIPENILQNINVVNDLLRPLIKGYSPENLKEIVSIVAIHALKENIPAPLRMLLIKKLVPQGDKYLKGLVDIGIILKTGTPAKGKSSYKYSFSPEYYSTFVSAPLNNAKLQRRIENTPKKTETENKGYSPQTRFLKLLTLDPGYIDLIETTFKKGSEKYNYTISAITRINNGDFFHTIDSTGGRYHSNITNLPKELRPYLRIKGERLINLDLKNSQPYLSILLLTNSVKASKLIRKNRSFSMLLQSLKVTQSQDVKEYINLVISGRFYEYLMDEFLKEGLTLTRSEAKEQAFKILFGPNRTPKNQIDKTCLQVFINNFPGVHETFSIIKGWDSFNRFAILLQRIESNLILNVILKRINKEHPGTIALTIHDSILTDKNSIETVHSIMIKEFTSFIGYSPIIKIEGISEAETPFISIPIKTTQKHTLTRFLNHVTPCIIDI